MAVGNANKRRERFVLLAIFLCFFLPILYGKYVFIRSRDAVYTVAIDDADSVGFRDRKMTIREFASAVKRKRIDPPVTKFVFVCADGTRHKSFLRARRILSAVGAYRFSLDVGGRRVPWEVGPSWNCCLPSRMLPRHVEKIYVTAHLVVIGKRHKFPAGDLGGECARMIKETIGRGDDGDSAVDITCEMKSLNGTLKKILSFVPETFCGRIFVSSIEGDDTDRWITESEGLPDE